ncbi:MAG: SRPBCC domain-containing protein [Dongiaceae bacterium]
MDASESAVEIRRRVDAAPEIVFAAFADRGLVSRWLKPAPEVRLDVLIFEFRVGGAYRFAYHAPGGQIMHVNGIFSAIEPPTDLIFSWNIEPPDGHAGVKSEVRVAIVPDGAGSELRIQHLNLSQPGATERHADGWRGALDQLAGLVVKTGDRV